MNVQTREVIVRDGDVADLLPGWPGETTVEAFRAWLDAAVAEIPEECRASAKIDITSCSGYEDDHYATICISYRKSRRRKDQRR